MDFGDDVILEISFAKISEFGASIKDETLSLSKDTEVIGIPNSERTTLKVFISNGIYLLKTLRDLPNA